MVRKNTKYSQEHFDEIKKLIPKTEKVDNVDKSVVERIKEEYKKLSDDAKNKQTEIDNKKDEANKIQEIIDNEDYKKYEAFFNNDPSVANKWNTTGWKNTIETWLQNNSNDCKITITANTLGVSTNTDIEITEDEALAIGTRAIKAFEGINLGDFQTQAPTTKTNGSTTISKTDAIARLKEVQYNANKLVKVKNKFKDGYREDYHLGYNYTNSSTNTPLTYSSDTIDWDNLVELAKYIDADDWSENSNKLDQSNFSDEINLKIYKKGKEYSKDEIKNYFGDINLGTGKLYKTGETPTTIKVKTIRDWAKLVLTLDSNSSAALNKIKGEKNHDTFVNPYAKLFSDLRTTEKDGNFTSSSHKFRIDKIYLPSLKTDRDTCIQRAALLGHEKDKIDADITKKESELDALITEKIKELRTGLATYNIEKGFKDKTNDTPKGDDNRKTSMELTSIFKTLKDIRYLENCDESKPSTDSTNGSKENTAYTELETILTDWDASYVKLFPNLDEDTNADKCKKIKESTNDLKNYKDDYEKWDKLIKFSDKQKQELKDIKIALGESEDPMDTLKTYTDKLKIIDASLETAFTEDLKTKWQGKKDGKDKFMTAETLKDLLESVKKDGKYDDFFNHIKGGTNGFEDIKDKDTWGKLILLEPKVVITAIKRYEYDKLGDNEPESNLDSKTQWERRIKKAYSKGKDHSLTDAEINTAVYEVAIGAKTLSAKALDANLKEIETPQQDDPNKKAPEKMSAFKEWFGFGHVGKSLLTYSGIIVVIGIICSIIWWDSIMAWWNNDKGKDEELDEAGKDD